jgi:hypothetical protein
MELLNATQMQAGYTMGMDASGRESLVVAVKGTFIFPQHPGDTPKLAGVQAPLVMSDTFTGEPGFSAPFYEVDYSPIKPFCDVVLVGGAYAPGGKPVTQVQVGMKVGAVAKTLMVVGDRQWEAGATGISPGYPLVFDYMPITYDRAFGGLDNFLADPDKHKAYMLNPVGKGFHHYLDSMLVDGTPMPNTEAANRPVRIPNHDYLPMAFGTVGRNWEPRYRYGGTYDDAWLEHQFPFLPKDFDNRYFQCAPADQQMPYPVGGEEVILINLTANGREQFRLPTLDVPVVFFRKKGERHETHAVIDTIVLEPDKGTFSMTWRASLPLRKNIFEIPQILVGKMSKGWWRARELGKTWYPSLAHLAQQKQREAAEEDA